MWCHLAWWILDLPITEWWENLDGAQSLENYVDDVLGHTVDWIIHKEMLRDFFERVRKANLSLKPRKCKIGFSQVDYLGAYLDKGFNLPTDRVSWTYPKNGATNNQEGMSKPSRHDKLLSTLHSKLCWNRCADNRIDEKQDSISRLRAIIVH